MQPVFRFAPSPNGELHLGHAWSALLNDRLCRASGGRLLVRIEDIDPARCRPEYEAGIFADLDWLGIRVDGVAARQSERMDDYRAALAVLSRRGLVYPAFLSRGQIAALAADRPGSPRDPDGAPLYPGDERTLDPAIAAKRIAAGESYAIRVDTARAALLAGPLAFTEDGAGPDGESGTVAADPAIWGDFIVARKETPTSYHLAVVVDDAAEGVTHVVRGRDLFHATAAHRLLQALLGYPAPRYHHHRLITDATGRKLAKSDRDTSLRALREAGVTPAEVRRMVGL